jgi:dihydrofolate synthase / folylpolyglutamate synthase
MISVEEEIFPLRPRFANQYNLALVLAKLGHPEKLIPTINVVGTNGKGSTSTYVSQGLKSKYPKVGLFISPAFLFHNERIQINNQPISDLDLRRYLKQIQI